MFRMNRMKQLPIFMLLFIFMNGCTLLTVEYQLLLSPVDNTESNKNFSINAKNNSDNASQLTENYSYWGPFSRDPYYTSIRPFPAYYYDPFLTGYYGYFPYYNYYDPVYYCYGYPYYYYDDFENYLKDIIRERFQHHRKTRRERLENIRYGFKDRRQVRRDLWKEFFNTSMDHPNREPFRPNTFRNWGRRRK